MDIDSETMNSPIQAQYFLSRPNGDLTAVIAVDELPPWVAIHGVPRLLSRDDTRGMTSLGTSNSHGHVYTVESGLDPHDESNLPHDTPGEGRPSSPETAGREGTQVSHVETVKHAAAPTWASSGTKTYEVVSWKAANHGSKELVKKVNNHDTVIFLCYAIEFTNLVAGLYIKEDKDAFRHYEEGVLFILASPWGM